MDLVVVAAEIAHMGRAVVAWCLPTFNVVPSVDVSIQYNARLKCE